MSKIIVLYDSWCPLCVSMKENIQRLNWLRLSNSKPYVMIQE